MWTLYEPNRKPETRSQISGLVERFLSIKSRNAVPCTQDNLFFMLEESDKAKRPNTDLA